MILRVIIFTFICCFHFESFAFVKLGSYSLHKGFAKIPFVSSRNKSKYEAHVRDNKKDLAFFCENLNNKYHKNSKKLPYCENKTLDFDLKSRSGYPLFYKTFGTGSNVTLILGGVHGDELSAIYLAFHLINYLEETPSAFEKSDIKVVVAPLVNPEGFFAQKPLRTNGRVDLNRNFLTRDWYKKSFLTHKSKLSRYFPGYFPNSEVETYFQKKLVAKFKPQKIISIHAPLGFLNYDGPLESSEACDFDKTGFLQNKNFIKSIAEKTNNYKIANYTFFTGSLGNYYGVERHIPTVTLELDSAIILQKKKYWSKFLSGLLESIHYKFMSAKA